MIAIRGAMSFPASPKVKLPAVSREETAPPAQTAKENEKPAAKEAAEEKPDEETGRVPGKLLAGEEDFLKAIQPEKEWPDPVAGVLVAAATDRDHWITASAAETVNALVEGSLIFTPIRLDKGVNAAHFLGPDKLLAAGYLWEENRKQLAYKPLVVVQPERRGFVIGFTADPNYRAYLDGMNILFLNAVFRGPAHARPSP